MSAQTIQLHDPTAELSPLIRPRRTPPESLDGKTVALFDIGKTRSDEFLDSLEKLFSARGIATARYGKPTNAKVASVETLQKVAQEADVVVSALAD